MSGAGPGAASSPSEPALDFKGVLKLLKATNALDGSTLGLAFGLTDQQKSAVVDAYEVSEAVGAAALIKKFTSSEEKKDDQGHSSTCSGEPHDGVPCNVWMMLKASKATGDAKNDDPEWDSLCKHYKPDLKADAYAALSVLPVENRRDILAMYKRSDDASVIEKALQCIDGVVGSKRSRSTAGIGASWGSMFAGGRILGKGGNGVVRAFRCSKGAAARKEFSSMSTRNHELSMLRLLQQHDVFPKLLPIQSDPCSIVMERYEPVCIRSQRQLKKASADLLEALKILWLLGYCHTDVHPFNVMFNPKTGRYVLIDMSNAVVHGTPVMYSNHEFVEENHRGKIMPASIHADRFGHEKVVKYWKKGVQDQ